MKTLNETLKEIQTKCFELLKLTGKAKKECLGIFDDEDAKREESEMAKMDLEDIKNEQKNYNNDHDCHASPEDGCDCQK